MPVKPTTGDITAVKVRMAHLSPHLPPQPSPRYIGCISDPLPFIHSSQGALSIG
jgi:hypothetical protein